MHAIGDVTRDGLILALLILVLFSLIFLVVAQHLLAAMVSILAGHLELLYDLLNRQAPNPTRRLGA